MTPWDKFLELSKDGADIRWVDGQWLNMAGVIRVQNTRGHKFYVRVLTMPAQFEGRYGKFKMMDSLAPYQNTPEQVAYFYSNKPAWLEVL